MPMELVTELPYNHPYRWDGTLFGGPKLWRPNNITDGLALWLDAEDAASITLNGSTVSQWADKSGNGRNATQATAVNQPTYSATGLNNKPVLSFDGVNDSIQSALTTIVFNTVPSFFAIITNTGTGSGGVFDFIGAGNYIDIFSAAPNQIRWELGNGATLGSNTHTVVGGTPYIFSAFGKTSAINGADEKAFAQSGELSASFSATLRIGSYFSFYKGYVAELIFLPYQVSTEVRKKIEGYLAWKWKLQANLPVDHPFKNLPPTV